MIGSDMWIITSSHQRQTQLPQPKRSCPVSATILDYLNKQNRPYSHIQVFDNLHGAIKKSSVQSTLDALEAEGKIKAFVFGKTKLFVANQDNAAGVVQPLDQEIAKLDEEIAKFGREEQGLRQAVSELENEIKQLESEPTTGEADTLIAKLEQETKEKRGE